jgi:glucose/arabinose dehydrogenase
MIAAVEFLLEVQMSKSRVRVMTAVLVVCWCAAAAAQTRRVPSNVQIHGGYSMEALATGLSFPTAVAVSGTRVWVAEAGFLPSTVPVIKQIDQNGTATPILSGTDVPGLLGPLTDVTFFNGWLWITHRQIGANGWLVGAISKFQPDNPKGTFATVITNLPAAGDHYAEEIVFDTSGRAYFSQGSATNSSVVGADNWYVTQWLQDPTLRNFHDFSSTSVVLNGTSYQTGAPFPLDPDASLMTAPFMPFGSGAVPSGTVIPAATPATPQEGIIAGNGAVYSFNPEAANPTTTLRLEAWGFRNPYGIGFDPSQRGTLLVSNNGADYRKAPINGQLQVVESRPVDNDWDDLFTVRAGGGAQFFGWPDFFHDPGTGAPVPATSSEFCVDEPATNPCPQFVFDDAFRRSLTVQPAFAELEHHSSANKFDFATDPQFRFTGDVFVAETGSLPPGTGAEDFVGYKVVRVNRNNGQVEDFIVHTKQESDLIFDPSGFNKPIDVKFHGATMLVVDFGVFEPGAGLITPNSGKIWIVSPVH